MNELGHIGSETAKLFVIECVGTRSSENAGAELEENAPGLLGHVELLHKPENETAQKQFPRFCHKTPSDFTEIVNDDLSDTLKHLFLQIIAGQRYAFLHRRFIHATKSVIICGCI
jgi:hypothetical protein